MVFGPLSRRSDQGQTFLRKYKCKEFCRPGGAGIPADLVRAAGLLIKHLSGGVGDFLLTGDFRDDIAFQYIHEDETGMTVRAADRPWSHCDRADVDLPSIHCQIGKVLFEDPLLDNSKGHNWYTGSRFSSNNQYIGACTFKDGAYHAIQPVKSTFLCPAPILLITSVTSSLRYR